MNKTPRLSKSGIEYLDYSWGIWSGCRNLETGACQVKACWAKGLTSHYPKIYTDGFKPHYYPEALESPKHLSKPSRISVGWVGDIIGYCDSRSIAKEKIEQTIKDCPQHTFLFLTKNPEKLHTWSPFPDNVWCGVSVTRFVDLWSSCENLRGIEASKKFISFEPLLERMSVSFDPEVLNRQLTGISWVIIGAQTKPTVMPKIEWVQEIVEAADKAGVKVFLKGNLYKLFMDAPHSDLFWEDMSHLRQEMP